MKSMKKALIMALMISGLVADSAKAVTVDVTLEPSAGTLLVCGLGLLMAFRATKIARMPKI